MVRAHRQAWAWQDEWFGLTMEDIREIERETQETLKKKMAVAEREVQEDDEDEMGNRGSWTVSSSGGGGDSVLDTSVYARGSVPHSSAYSSHAHLTRTSYSHQSSTEREGSAEITVQINDLSEGKSRGGEETPTASSTSRGISGGMSGAESKGSHWSRTGSKVTLNSPGSVSSNSFDLLATLRMESIMRKDSDSGSEEEFFDCQGNSHSHTHTKSISDLFRLPNFSLLLSCLLKPVLVLSPTNFAFPSPDTKVASNS